MIQHPAIKFYLDPCEQMLASKTYLNRYFQRSCEMSQVTRFRNTRYVYCSTLIIDEHLPAKPGEIGEEENDRNTGSVRRHDITQLIFRTYI